MTRRLIAASAAFAIVDQGVTSAANFVANALLIHYASKQGYGIYVVAFSTLLLIGSTVDVVFSLQMSYLAPHHRESTRKMFCVCLRTAQTCVSLGLSIVICGASIAAALLGYVSASTARFGIIIGIGSLLISYHEYYRSLLYLFDSARYVLVLTGMQIGTWSAVIIADRVLGTVPLNQAVLAGYCLGAGCAAMAGRILLPLPAPPAWSDVRAAAREAWEQGSWSLMGSVISWTQGQSYAWLLAAIAGASAAAEANFAKLFFSPLGLMLTAVNRVARPGLGKVYAGQGDRAAVKQGRMLLVGVVLVVAAYCPAVLVSKNWIIAHTGTRSYSNAGVLILAWGLVTTFQVTRWNSTLLLGVLRRNRHMTAVQAIAAVVALTASAACIPRFGAMGAILSVGLGELILTGLMWREVNRAITGKPTLMPTWGLQSPQQGIETPDVTPAS